ncbi:hypothetical protein FD723_39965 (plasmid) [Nostoc sp. C052]|uniref:hypothetical protein n=1 Tax=Nostoc sp. C052 TaxID=2576902 RepID=UPI0015C404FE|nr:hypothetical protein [Nostoc sp. C052]QLE46390.1 hypothetical protein FD723_39965 [Nostoc sp. C052]
MKFQELFAAFVELYGEDSSTKEKIEKYWNSIDSTTSSDPYEEAEYAASSSFFTETESAAKTAILHGDGSHNAPYWLNGLRNEERGSLRGIIELAESKGITRISFLGSGRYLEKRSDGWFITSDSECCDKVHALPPKGKKMYENI